MRLSRAHVGSVVLPEGREDVCAEVEVRRGDTHDRVRTSVERKPAADRICALKTALPQAVADDHDRCGRRLILISDEATALRVVDAENGEQIGRYLARIDIVGWSWRADDAAVEPPRSHRQRL